MSQGNGEFRKAARRMNTVNEIINGKQLLTDESDAKFKDLVERVRQLERAMKNDVERMSQARSIIDELEATIVKRQGAIEMLKATLADWLPEDDDDDDARIIEPDQPRIVVPR